MAANMLERINLLTREEVTNELQTRRLKLEQRLDWMGVPPNEIPEIVEGLIAFAANLGARGMVGGGFSPITVTKKVLDESKSS